MRPTRTANRVLTWVGAATVVAGLTGCGGGERPAVSGRPDATTGVSASAPRADEDNQALLNAGEAAQQAVTGGTVISIETDSNDTRWEVRVVTADVIDSGNTKHEVRIDAESGEVVTQN
jgi:starvation-inducible outer membrane lipoprotein